MATLLQRFHGLALEPSHAQRVDDNVARHVLAQAPANHLTDKRVDHHGQKQPTFVGGDVGNVAPQTQSSCATVVCRSSRLSAIGRSWALSVMP
jgi:hypothetical protein